MKKLSMVIILAMVLTAGSALAGQQQNKPISPRDLSQAKVLKNDIAITDISVDNGCFLKVTFENKGNVEINTTLPVKIWVNGLMLKDQPILFDHLAAGASRSHIYCAYAKPIIINGIKTVKAWVGSVRTWRESLLNNTLTKSVSCKPNFDIAVTDIGLDENCILWVKFENRGGTRIHTKLHVKVWINRKLVKDKEMLFDDFSAGTWRTHHYTGATPLRILKAVTVKASVDTTNMLPETNEFNNTLSKNVECPIKPAAGLHRHR